MTKVYTAKAINHGGRKGQVELEDSGQTFQFDKPAEMGGQGEGANPEQFFAAAYSSCFGGALEAVAQEQGIDLPEDFSVEAAVSFNKDENQGKFFLTADIAAELPGLEKRQAQQLVEQAHQVCPYSVLSREGAEVNVQLREAKQAQR